MKIHKYKKYPPMKIVATWSNGTTHTETDFHDYADLTESVSAYRNIFNSKTECRFGILTGYTVYIGTTVTEKDGKKI